MPPKPPAHKQLERLKPVAQPSPTARPPAFAQQVLQPVPQIMVPPPPPPPQPVYEEREPELLVDDTLQPEEPSEPPLAGPNVMNIVMVGAECAPWSKTGGLGDVMGALPKAFARRGHRVMVVAPRYENYDDAWETGIRRIFRVCNQDVEVSSNSGAVNVTCYRSATVTILVGGCSCKFNSCTMIEPCACSCVHWRWHDRHILLTSNTQRVNFQCSCSYRSGLTVGHLLSSCLCLLLLGRLLPCLY